MIILLWLNSLHDTLRSLFIHFENGTSFCPDAYPNSNYDHSFHLGFWLHSKVLGRRGVLEKTGSQMLSSWWSYKAALWLLNALLFHLLPFEAVLSCRKSREKIREELNWKPQNIPKPFSWNFHVSKGRTGNRLERRNLLSFLHPVVKKYSRCLYTWVHNFSHIWKTEKKPYKNVQKTFVLACFYA